MGFTFTFNRSDSINGWNGDFNDGFIVFYTHSNTRVLQLKHSILLNPKSTPVVSVQEVEKHFLGEPFTNCLPIHEPGHSSYSEEFCLLRLLLHNLCKECSCYPPYITGIDELMSVYKEWLRNRSPFGENQCRNRASIYCPLIVTRIIVTF